MSQAERFISYEPDDTERGRYISLLSTLCELRPFIESRRILDFGASYGLSICALLETGASYVVGVELDKLRLEYSHLALHK